MGLEFLLNVFSSSYDPSYEERKESLSRASGRNIMVVDDDDDFRFLLRDRLERMGCLCFEAENGDVAKFYLKRNHVDLVITDNHMPGTDGMELIDWLQETQRHVPIILVSGDISRPVREKAEEAGVYACMEKPCSLSEISSKVEEVLKEL
jgi:two-component system, NarL family, sensor histidine kinase EvgS